MATASTELETIPTSFLSLPPELRTKIYRFLWHESINVSLCAAPGSANPISSFHPESPVPIRWSVIPNVALANKQLNIEAIPEYYRAVRICTRTETRSEHIYLFKALKHKDLFLQHVHTLTMTFNDIVFKPETMKILKATDRLRRLRLLCQAAYEPVRTSPTKTFDRSVVLKALRKAMMNKTASIMAAVDGTLSAAEDILGLWELHFGDMSRVTELVLEFEYQYVDKLNVGADQSGSDISGTSAKRKMLCTYSLPSRKLVVGGKVIPEPADSWKLADKAHASGQLPLCEDDTH